MVSFSIVFCVLFNFFYTSKSNDSASNILSTANSDEWNLEEKQALPAVIEPSENKTDSGWEYADLQNVQ